MCRENKNLLPVVECYENYKESFRKGFYTYSDFVNAAFIAFLSQDYGFSSEHKLSRKFVENCTRDMYFLLDEGRSLFPDESLRFDFWAKYFRHIVENKEEPNFNYYFEKGVLEAGIWSEHLDFNIVKKLQAEPSYKNEYLLSLI